MKKMDTFRSDFLFPETDFIIGMGSVLNISGNYFEFAGSKNEFTADLKALSSDWSVAGQEISNALKCCSIDNREQNQTEEICY